MKLKKKIMLVLSMAIMTLSIFLNDIQVLAATDSISDLIVVGNKAYESAWYYGPEVIIREGGQAVTVGSDVYRYKDTLNEQIEVKISGLFDFNLMTASGLNSYTFSDATQGLIWSISGSVFHGFLTSSTSSSPDLNVKFTLVKAEFYVYNQPYDIPIYSNSIATQSGVEKETNIGSYVHIPSVSAMKTISEYDVKVEFTYMLSFSVSDMDTTATYTIKPRCWVKMNYLHFYEVYSVDTTNLVAILGALNEIKLLIGQNQNLMQTYYPKLNELLLRLTHIDLDMDSLIDLADSIITELEEVNTELDSITDEIHDNTGVLVNIRTELNTLRKSLVNSSDDDKSTTDGFKQDSDLQSSELNNLNQQTQVDRIDVDSASGSVDDNLDVEVDANYGVLLSTFTENKNILTMLLAVASMGLISYVLFGKR